MTIYLFAGPTLARLGARGRELVAGMEVRPPIGRGDVRALVARERPGTIVISDGLFHMGRLAVGHAEIREALHASWRVWGVSSMGAIRAAEMESLGMRGFGQVFERFRDDPDFSDDEVTLLHESEAPWRELSEPLVHMRVALADLVEHGALVRTVERAIVDDLARRWFGERTLSLLGTLVRSAGAEIDVADFDRHRIKVRDLEALLTTRPFEVS